jgi:hypothetical protein
MGAGAWGGAESPASHEAGYALDEATRAGLTPESPASHEAGYAAWS